MTQYGNNPPQPPSLWTPWAFVTAIGRFIVSASLLIVYAIGGLFVLALGYVAARSILWGVQLFKTAAGL